MAIERPSQKYQQVRVKDNPNFRNVEGTNFYISRMGEVYRSLKTLDRRIQPFKHHNIHVIKIRCKEVNFPRLVWETFNGKIPEGYCVVHKISQKDHSLNNLKLMSTKEMGKYYGGRTTRTRYYYCEETGKRYKGYRGTGKALNCSKETIRSYAKGNVKNPMFTIKIIRERPYGGFDKL